MRLAFGDDLRAGAQTRWLSAIALISLMGVIVSGISLQRHFATSKSSFCDIGQTFNCDLVNRSLYSTFLGVPVAMIGVVGYLLLLSLATVYRRKPETPMLLAIASALGLSFALYLTYIEAQVLVVWCLLCLISLGLILANTILSAALAVKSGRRR